MTQFPLGSLHAFVEAAVSLDAIPAPSAQASAQTNECHQLLPLGACSLGPVVFSDSVNLCLASTKHWERYPDACGRLSV